MLSNPSSDSVPNRPGGKRALQQLLPAGWRFAHQSALDLISQMEHLAWRDRAGILDAYYSQQADGMLGASGMSAMVGARPTVVPDGGRPIPPSERAADFAVWCRAVTTAVLIELDQSLKVEEPAQALTFLVARDWQFAKSAAAWVARNGMAEVGEVLKTLPGYAMVFLATSPNDTVERFMARDAFWQAMATKT